MLSEQLLEIFEPLIVQKLFENVAERGCTHRRSIALKPMKIDDVLRQVQIEEDEKTRQVELDGDFQASFNRYRQAETLSIPLASGLIAGEAILAVIIPLLILVGLLPAR